MKNPKKGFEHESKTKMPMRKRKTDQERCHSEWMKNLGRNW